MRPLTKEETREYIRNTATTLDQSIEGKDLIKKYLPKSFYAGLDSEERLKMLIKHWQRAIKIINKINQREIKKKA